MKRILSFPVKSLLRSRSRSKNVFQSDRTPSLDGSSTTTADSSVSEEEALLSLRVSFDETQNSFISCDDQQQPEDLSVVWYTRQELKDIKAANLALARQHEKTTAVQHYRTTLQHAWEATRRTATIADVDRTALQEASITSDEPWWGLERQLVKEISVAATESRIKQVGSLYVVSSQFHDNPEGLALELSQTCERASRSCCKLAALLGLTLADELAATADC